MKVCYIGPIADSSGYSAAARNNIAALHRVGVPISVVPISFEPKKADTGKWGKICESLKGNSAGCNIQIIHATPPNFSKHIDKSKYNIGYVAWETSLLPPNWKDWINQLNEVWVPSTYNVKVFRDSGVNIPVTCIPHTFGPLEEEGLNNEAKCIQDIGSDSFLFYNIFQWLERKNPLALLKAYLTEFRADEKVCLLMKTFRLLPGAAQDSDIIKTQVQTLKSRMYLPSYPRVLLVSSLLSMADINAIHKRGDCLISLNRCEGFGIPLIEAMRAGNPVIATNYGGPEDFLEVANQYPVNYQLTPVCGMPWNMYQANQIWADPDIIHARGLMRKVFQNREEAIKRGNIGREWVKENLSHEKIGTLMRERLAQIVEA